MLISCETNYWMHDKCFVIIEWWILKLVSNIEIYCQGEGIDRVEGKVFFFSLVHLHLDLTTGYRWQFINIMKSFLESKFFEALFWI